MCKGKNSIDISVRTPAVQLVAAILTRTVAYIRAQSLRVYQFTGYFTMLQLRRLSSVVVTTDVVETTTASRNRGVQKC